MNASRRTGRRSGHRSGRSRRTSTGRGLGRRRVRVVLGVAAAVAVLVAGCASFPETAPSFGPQPSLTPNVATLITPTPQGGTSRTSPRQSSASGSPGDPASPTPSTGQTPADPCAPSLPPVIATCLTSPWGLAPLPDGQSALVGERTTGKILLVAPGRKPELVARVTGLDTSGGGGLLGIALSPYYAEDGLVYAYVTTAQDNRILRIAPGQNPKAIFTGIPSGDEHNGGPIAFGTDDLLYVATGDAGLDAPGADSLAGKVLRLDAFGKPAGGPGGAPQTGGPQTSGPRTSGPPTSGPQTSGPQTSGPQTSGPQTTQSGEQRPPAVYASGLADPTGICPLPGGDMGVIDHRGSGDVLIPVQLGADYTHPASGDTLWRYEAGDGGAVDCAVSGGYLLATSLPAEKVTAIQMMPGGGFTGSPQDLAAKQFGRLLTIVTGVGDLVWMTTSNKDGHGDPSPSDDRVVVLPAGGGGGGGGGAD